MYTKQQLQSLIHLNPILRKTATTSLNAGNTHVQPSPLHPNPPKIGTTFCDGRYTLVDVNHVNREPVSNYFFDGFGGVRAYEHGYSDQWFIMDEKARLDTEGHPIVFQYPFGWSDEDVTILNDKFFQHPNILQRLNTAFIAQLNTLRAKYNLAPVELDETLKDGSFIRTSESCKSNFVHPDHVRPNGERYHTAFAYRNTDAEFKIGENQVAMPYNGNVYTLLHPTLIELAMTEWINSPSHLENFLHEPYTKAYISVQLSKHSPWIDNERTAYFTPSVYLTCHMAI